MKITLIGAGKLGNHLAVKLAACGEKLLQIFSRKAEKAAALAKQTGASPCHRLEEISAGADLYLLCVADDAIGEVAKNLRKTLPKDSFLAHTSGSQPSDLLGQDQERRGVFYPLQSFSPDKTPEWSEIPFCLYASQKEDEKLLLQLARKISSRTYLLDDQQRSELHLAAVFANNFTNYLLSIAYERCEQHDIPFDLLHPLILETARKAVNQPPPARHQTGPAVRNDQKTIQKHLQQLRQNPSLQKLYVLLTENIRK